MIDLNLLKATLLFLTLFSLSSTFSQEIFGVILDGDSKNPIEGASIYFDKTTIGTTSNKEGEFILKYNKAIKTPLVISFIGYETVIFDNLSENDKMEIYLYQTNEVLDEVVLTHKEAWPRKLKLQEFIKYYIGETTNGKSCEILNEDDIILKYNEKTKQLMASANVPILIKNNSLKYLITAELEHFEVNYSYVSKNKKHLNLRYFYYSGANFFKSLEEKPTQVTLKKRQAAYRGSVLHFMRALAQEKLNANGYQIRRKGYSVSPKKYIAVIKDSSNRVSVKLKEKLNILYKDGRQSTIEVFTDEFYIDPFGNHSPTDKVRFGGDLGMRRMGDVLPLDFLIQNKR